MKEILYSDIDNINIIDLKNDFYNLKTNDIEKYEMLFNGHMINYGNEFIAKTIKRYL